MDASVNELLSHPINLNGVFIIRTASRDTERASLDGLPSAATYPKTYRLLKMRLEHEQCRDTYDVESETHDEHQRKLENVLACLSDAQFEVFGRILARSPIPRHRMYLGICATLSRDLVAWQEIQESPQPGALILSPLAFPIAQYLPGPRTRWDALQHRPPGWKSRFVFFSIVDVDGAQDLLLRIALNMQESGLDLGSANIILLQRFASLSETISSQLTRKWMSKWPMDWLGINEFTLDLRNAYAPDGVFLASNKWLGELNRHRNAAPAMFRILAPTPEIETEAYAAFGYSGPPSVS